MKCNNHTKNLQRGMVNSANSLFSNAIFKIIVILNRILDLDTLNPNGPGPDRLGFGLGAKGPGPDRLGFGLGAKGPGPDRLGFGLGGQGSWAGPAWHLFLRLDTAFIFRLDTAIIFRLATAIIFRLDTAIIFRVDAAIIFRLDTAIGRKIEPNLILWKLFTNFQKHNLLPK